MGDQESENESDEKPKEDKKSKKVKKDKKSKKKAADQENEGDSDEVEIVANTPEDADKEKAGPESDTEEVNIGEIEDDAKKRKKEIKLIKKESKAKNKALKTIIKLFKKKLDFEGSENIKGYMEADSEKLKKWVEKLEVHGLMMAKELLQDGLFTIARDDDKMIIPFSADTYMKNKRIYIKLG